MRKQRGIGKRGSGPIRQIARDQLINAGNSSVLLALCILYIQYWLTGRYLSWYVCLPGYVRIASSLSPPLDPLTTLTWPSCTLPWLAHHQVWAGLRLVWLYHHPTSPTRTYSLNWRITVLAVLITVHPTSPLYPVSSVYGPVTQLAFISHRRLFTFWDCLNSTFESSTSAMKCSKPNC